MSAGHVDVPMSSVMNNVTVKVSVSGVASFKARLWIGAMVIKCGVWITGCKSEIEIKR